MQMTHSPQPTHTLTHILRGKYCAWGRNSTAQRSEVWWSQLKKSGPAMPSPRLPTPVGSAWQTQEAQVAWKLQQVGWDNTTKAYRMTLGLPGFKLSQNVHKRVHINITHSLATTVHQCPLHMQVIWHPSMSINDHQCPYTCRPMSINVHCTCRNIVNGI